MCCVVLSVIMCKLCIFNTARSCLAAAAYLMLKFSWSSQKALEYLKFKRPESHPKIYFVKQLQKCAKQLGYVTHLFAFIVS